VLHLKHQNHPLDFCWKVSGKWLDERRIFPAFAAAPKHRLGEMSDMISGELLRASHVVNGCVAALPSRCQLRCRCVVVSVASIVAVCG
jgi:hypothetical protein